MAAPRQLSLIEPSLSVTVVDPGADYGEVFTRPWVVHFILDLAGYTHNLDLGAKVLVEPSCGSGAFLLPIVDRLVESAAERGRPLDSLGSAIRAFDLLDANAKLARKNVELRLLEAGTSVEQAGALATEWVRTGDFLLHDHELASADFVVGNPPYVRLESVPTDRMAAYRAICPTMRGRADIYVGFIERGLSLLRDGGTLGFICADRWMHNQYGTHLRQLVAADFSVECVVAMHDVDAFEDEVSAYPAVVILRNRVQGRATVVDASGDFGERDAKGVSKWARSRRSARTRSGRSFEASKLETWFPGEDLWPSASPDQIGLLADLEAKFPPLEDPSTGTRVGIGVATGCDEVYITRDAEVVERDRLLPLLRASDITSGAADWSGEYLVNPWNGSGLVDLDRFPKLSGYLTSHEDRLRGRHVARKRPKSWYRTIDRVHGDLQVRPKLVLPDMKAAAHPVLDDGQYYPHHNLYYVVSDTWDLEVLGGLLLSDVANLFVGAYCVKMRGGCYRFQAQYLRRIRVPTPDSLDAKSRRALARAFGDRDVEAATAAAAKAYAIDSRAIDNEDHG